MIMSRRFKILRIMSRSAMAEDELGKSTVVEVRCEFLRSGNRQIRKLKLFSHHVCLLVHQ